MTGEEHTLTATPGEGVDIASRRRPVTEKAGAAITKLEKRKQKPPEHEERVSALKGIIATAEPLEEIVRKMKDETGKKGRRPLDYPGFAVGFRKLKSEIVEYGVEFNAKDLTEGDLPNRDLAEKEIRDDIVRVARRNDKSGPYATVVGQVVTQVNAVSKISQYTAYLAPASTREYPEWKGVDVIEGATYRLVDRYRKNEPREYSVLIGDQDVIGEDARASLVSLRQATNEAAAMSPADIKAAMSPRMHQAGQRALHLRSQFVGTVIEKRVAELVAADQNIKQLGAARPGDSVPDFLVRDGGRDIAVDITGSSSTSINEHMQRTYISREEPQIIAYPTIQQAVLDAVFGE